EDRIISYVIKLQGKRNKIYQRQMTCMRESIDATKPPYVAGQSDYWFESMQAGVSYEPSPLTPELNKIFNINHNTLDIYWYNKLYYSPTSQILMTYLDPYSAWVSLEEDWAHHNIQVFGDEIYQEWLILKSLTR